MYYIRNHLDEPYHTFEFEMPADADIDRIHARIEKALKKHNNIAWDTQMTYNNGKSHITVKDAKTAIRDIEPILKEENVYLRFEGMFYHAQSSDSGKLSIITKTAHLIQEVIDNPATAEEMDMIKTTCTAFSICIKDSYQTNCLYIQCQDLETLDFVIQTAGIYMVSIRFDFL